MSIEHPTPYFSVVDPYAETDERLVEALTVRAEVASLLRQTERKQRHREAGAVGTSAEGQSC